MYTEEDITSAVEAGVLTHESAAALRAHVAGLKQGYAVDEEHFRLVTGFNDIFVVIACLLLLAPLAWIGAAIAPWLGAVAVATAAWALAEFFTRKRHMALPSILLLLAFVGGTLFAAHLVSGGNAFFAGALAVIAAWFHWQRFHVPITVAAGSAVIVGTIMGLIMSGIPHAKSWVMALTFAAGVMVFLLAMRWDMSDVARQTRRSDVAFWLHLLAAPLLVHPVFSVLGVFHGSATLSQVISVIGLYGVLALVSLWTDRRALMVSALGYVLFTFTALLKQFGLVSLSFAFTALVIGLALLVLSAFWHPSRAYVLRWVPAGLQKRLAPSQ